MLAKATVDCYRTTAEATGRDCVRPRVEHHLIANWQRLFGYALSLTRDGDTARDLLQQAALQALSTKYGPADERSARAWLFRIVRNSWIDRFRRDTAYKCEEWTEHLERNNWDFDDRLIADLTVRQGLALLEPAHQEVIQLVDICGFSYAETAEILSVPAGTVMSRLSRARLALLNAIGGNVASLEARRRSR